LMPGDQCLTTKRGCSSCSQKDCQSRKLPEKAAATKPETSNTPAETSGIAMKAQPTE
ncbi:MAG: methionine synthase, partial [Veillonella sp.]|nr:methionine synthase [Veillonella sp.]